MMLLAFPAMKEEHGLVREQLLAQGASAEIIEAWKVIVKTPIGPDEEDDEFGE
jgi:hypothetical protein